MTVTLIEFTAPKSQGNQSNVIVYPLKPLGLKYNGLVGLSPVTHVLRRYWISIIWAPTPQHHPHPSNLERAKTEGR